MIEIHQKSRKAFHEQTAVATLPLLIAANTAAPQPGPAPRRRSLPKMLTKGLTIPRN
jgi:hypothetical protein